MRFGSVKVPIKVVAKEFGISISRVSQIVNESIRKIRMYSIEEKPDEEITGFSELCKALDCDESDTSIFHIINALDSITDQKAAMVIKLKYGLFGGKKLSPSEISEIFGISRARVSQLEKEAVRSLRHRSRRHMIVAN